MKLFKKAIGALLATTMIATSVVSVSAVENTQTEKTASLPSAYSSAEQGYLTPVKDQGMSNMCCSYAAMAACEASMIINNGYDTSLDLSELHSHYTLHTKPVDKLGMFDSSPKRVDFVDNGSHGTHILFNLVNNNGVVTESANHGQFASSKIDSNFNVYNPESRYSYSEAYIKNAYYSYTTNPTLVKQLIMKYGGGLGEMCAVTSDGHGNPVYYYNEETGAYYNYDADIAYPGHAITFVGWDDNYPKENCTVFGHTPKNDGAWLIKNSSGTENGVDGYNWVSYEDLSIDKRVVIFFELSTDEPYQYTYQYDDLCDEHFLYGIVGGTSMANIFTSLKENETLGAVSFYTSDDKLDFKVKVYSDVTGNTNPTNGTLEAVVTGEDILMGYHTIELPTPVQLEKGEQFSVVVTLEDKENPSRNVKVNIDYSSYLNGYTKISEYGESFVCEDGKTWDDIRDMVDGNLRIKAFTNSTEEPAEVVDYYDSYAGKTREEWRSGLEAVTDKVYSDLETGYVYQLSSYLYSYLEIVDYYKNVSQNPENYLAIEFAGCLNDLSEKWVSECEIVNDIKYYDTAPLWEEFKTVYDELRKDFLAKENIEEIDSSFNEAYKNYIVNCIENGAFNSYLQNFGDTDNDGSINITDATTIQMLIAKLDEFDFMKFYNSDVDGDGNINIKDATAVQMYVSKFADYMPVYNKQIADETVVENIDYKTAVQNLQTAKENVENHSIFNLLEYNTGDSKFAVLWCQYNDAVEVLMNSENYHPAVLDFKARCLKNSLSAFDVY